MSGQSTWQDYHLEKNHLKKKRVTRYPWCFFYQGRGEEDEMGERGRGERGGGEKEVTYLTKDNPIRLESSRVLFTFKQLMNYCVCV